MIPAYSPPAAWMSGNTEATYSSGTVTSHQAGSRSQGSRTTRAAVSARIAALAIAYGTEAGPGGSARLASARMARAANGAIRASQPVPPQGRAGRVSQRVRGTRGVRRQARECWTHRRHQSALPPFICLSSLGDAPPELASDGPQMSRSRTLSRGMAGWSGAEGRAVRRRGEERLR